MTLQERVAAFAAADLYVVITEAFCAQRSPVQVLAAKAQVVDPAAVEDREQPARQPFGIAQLFSIVSTAAPAAGEFQPVAAGNAAPSKEEVSRTCLEAHETLMELNPANVAKFKDVAKFLAEDLKRLQKKPATGDPAADPAPGASE